MTKKSITKADHIANLRRFLIRTSLGVAGLYLRVSRANRLALRLLPEVTIVDVGASHFLHRKWLPAFQNITTNVVAVDPNEWNLDYLRSIRLRATLIPYPTALSGEGGNQTFYVTNVDTGSSLNRPSPTPIQNTRLGGQPHSYFYPMREVSIPTETLEMLVENLKIHSPMFIKLDTQGSELDILLGATNLFDEGQIVMVESEASLLRETNYEGATRLADLTLFMESRGFDLVELRPISSQPTLNNSQGVLNECDSTFIMGFERTLQSSIEVKLAVFYAYLLIGQNDLAQRLLTLDQELMQKLLQILSIRQVRFMLKNFRRIS